MQILSKNIIALSFVFSTLTNINQLAIELTLEMVYMTIKIQFPALGQEYFNDITYIPILDIQYQQEL